MSRKNYNYFDKFAQQMQLSKKAAQQFMSMLEDYSNVPVKADKIHDTEHEADLLLHEIMNELNRSFITPIDQEDIVKLVNELDNITDSIEDVANLFDMLSITKVLPEAIKMAQFILQSCEALYNAIVEFAHYKNSKTLSEFIIEVNRIEEEGDRWHRKVTKDIYKNENDPIFIMKWKEIFDTMEDVLDYCEDVADLLDELIIKNS